MLQRKYPEYLHFNLKFDVIKSTYIQNDNIDAKKKYFKMHQTEIKYIPNRFTINQNNSKVQKKH